ncbi:hypothetical protein SAMN06296065_1471, partial [Novosphingobium panipatense]
MPPPALHVLSEAEKNDLLLAQRDMIERMAAPISELEALVGKPRKTSKNSHVPPSKDDFGKGGGKGRKAKPGKRPSREGKHRPLAETPDKIERVIAAACGHCGSDVSGQTRRCRHRYDHIDLPPIRPVVTRVELLGGRCRGVDTVIARQPRPEWSREPRLDRASALCSPICTTAIMSVSRAVAHCIGTVRPEHLPGRHRQCLPAHGSRHGDG